MTRVIQSGSLVRDQVDLYNPLGGFVRATGVTTAGVSVTLFVNNLLTVWPVIDGTLVADSSISSGNVYFNEIFGSPGFYQFRFFPDRVGYWKFVFGVTLTTSEVIKEYDSIVTSQTNTPGSLNASFIK